jgi:hypothetical protein
MVARYHYDASRESPPAKVYIRSHIALINYVAPPGFDAAFLVAWHDGEDPEPLAEFFHIMISARSGLLDID